MSEPETSRISLELPVPLLDRIDRQVEYTSLPRQHLLEVAIVGLVREFERIDVEAGVACPRCKSDTEVDMFEEPGSGTLSAYRVCVRCTWRWRE